MELLILALCSGCALIGIAIVIVLIGIGIYFDIKENNKGDKNGIF